ncbi:MAG: NADH-quinone oxidoreductase subunit M [Candidatus Thorarchaeota archaeon]|nr:MAG: NADH-quinone oxidoreductase subunit M [Candidatus Thorarchaeota archaeon]RLI58449.1 MAG: NADH-quinone oxidoreductase subunit M [Candidatus Thorarchaeota archaeon]
MQSALAEAILSMLPGNVLILMLVIPLVGGFLAYVLGSRSARAIALLTTTVELGFAIVLALGTPAMAADHQGMSYYFEMTLATLGTSSSSPAIRFVLGVDGISLVMILLSNLVVFIAALSSNHIKDSERSYYALFLLLQTGLLGVFMSLDLIGFFLFWELVLIPMFFIVGGWGEEGSQHAAVKFFIYTHFGSGVMLVGFFVLYLLSAPVYTFNMLVLRGMGLDPMVQIGFAIALFFGAGVKLPVWPLHNWLPWAHVKAPTPGSVILAGILLKMGGYAFVRLGLWMVPDAIAALAIPFAVLAIFTCIYAAFTAMAQTDMKSMVAYTSINHMSWVLLGVAAYGWNYSIGATMAANLALQGAIFMMFSHGTIISVMFIVAGQMKYAAGTREIPEIKGLMAKAPHLASVTILASLAAFGLPGFSGFIAEILVLFGSVVNLFWTALITFGIFVTVGYILWMLNRVVFSDPDEEKEITEAPWEDLIAPILMMIPVILLGIWPDLIIGIVQPVIDVMLAGGALP